MKRFLALLLTIMLMVPALAACGENSGENDNVSEAFTEVPTEEATVVSDEVRGDVRAIAEESFDNRGFKGAAYLVYHGEEVYAGGAGKANKKEDIDNSPDVVYHIASVTKQFTAAAILKLCGEGKMSVNDTLFMYFPDYETGADITVHNLLSMQSGIPDYVRGYDENGYEMEISSQPVIDGVEDDNSLEENRDALRKWIFAQELLFDQGDRFSYCNSNYFLLGEIIEKVSGISYFDYLRTYFFEPLDMETAGFMEDYDKPDAIVAVGYHNTGAADLLTYQGAAFGCGDMMASPKDLYKWTVALHHGRVLSDEMYQLMITEHCKGSEGNSSYGYGLMIGSTGLLPFYFHSGSIPCFLSCVMYIPQIDLYAAVMSNYFSETLMSAEKDITEGFLKKIGLLADTE